MTSIIDKSGSRRRRRRVSTLSIGDGLTDAVPEVVTVSPKYQVVIPSALRRQLNILPGQQLELVVEEGRILLVPLKPMEEYEGLLRGREIDFEREPDREL